MSTGGSDSELDRLQRRFWRAISSPVTVDQALPDLAAADPGMVPLTGWLRGTSDEFACQRLNVYANMYFFRILGVVREDYPQIVRWLGDEAFHNLVTSYLVAYPSTNPSIRHVGSRLADYLGEQAELLARYPGIVDLARLEWARGLAFDGEDGPELTGADLAGVPADAWARLRFRLAPSLHRVDCAYPAQTLWQALSAETSAPVVEPVATHLLVWRRGFTVYHRASSPAEQELLDMLQDGLSFAAICEALYAEHGEGAAQVAFKRLSTWIDHGLLSEIAW